MLGPMSETVTISEAKTQLSRLIAKAERGEEVTIRRGDRPVARLVAIDPPNRSRRSPIGALAGRIRIDEGADELGPEWDPYQ